ncbi:MAG: nucleotide pyrophosphohydrolase [Mycobacteriales bacterium]
MADELEDLRNRLRLFADDRDWQQFHTPRNLALALAGEVGELAAVLQWLTDEEAGVLSPRTRDQLADEVADILIYLVRFADVVGLDPLAEAHKKIARNEQRYPPDRFHGTAPERSGRNGPSGNQE